MSDTLLNQLRDDQQSMTRKAVRTVLIIALCIHILLNAFAYFNHDPILKIEMPVLSAITIAAILVSMRAFKHN